MHVIARATLDAFGRKHRAAKEWLENWWQTAVRANWRNLDDVRRVYQSTDQVGGCLVFDCKGNNYRLIVRVSYANKYTRGTLFVKHLLTHAEYNKNRWKDCCE
ncbi:MAG TPA: type II toxin-antitoxin system HigB family toxin [Pirellulaceae bacterium]|nr:type II toxin-antitoxin system HigB family toxin [Pirellulaceae bacterium]